MTKSGYNWKRIISEGDWIIGAEAYSERSRDRDMEETYPAAMDAGQLEANTSIIIKEGYNGSYYPRPAMTKSGIIFSYQPYEKGAFYEGILHFVIPYSLLKPKIVL